MTHMKKRICNRKQNFQWTWGDLYKRIKISCNSYLEYVFANPMFMPNQIFLPVWMFCRKKCFCLSSMISFVSTSMISFISTVNKLFPTDPIFFPIPTSTTWIGNVNFKLFPIQFFYRRCRVSLTTRKRWIQNYFN